MGKCSVFRGSQVHSLDFETISIYDMKNDTTYTTTLDLLRKDYGLIGMMHILKENQLPNSTNGTEIFLDDEAKNALSSYLEGCNRAKTTRTDNAEVISIYDMENDTTYTTRLTLLEENYGQVGMKHILKENQLPNGTDGTEIFLDDEAKKALSGYLEKFQRDNTTRTDKNTCINIDKEGNNR